MNMQTTSQRNARSGQYSMSGKTLLAIACLAICGTANPAELEIKEGVVVKFGRDAGLDVRDRLVAHEGAALTSRNDDSAAGAIDDSTPTPAAGDWRGVRVEKTASANDALGVNGVSIRYAGGGEEGAALELRGNHPALNGLELFGNKTGLLLREGASPSISGSSFQSNDVGIDARDSALPSVGNSQFSGNRIRAIENRTPTRIIRATGNWWGQPSGPKDPVANPGGTGDAVSAGVNYGSYLTLAPLLSPSIRLTEPAPYFDVRRIRLEVACLNATEYRIAENGAFAGVAFKPLSGGRASVDFDMSAVEGLHAIDVQFRSAGGAIVASTVPGGVVYDLAAPTIVLTNPAAGSLVRDPISIQANATDAAGIASVGFFVDGQPLDKDTSAPYAVQWDPGSVADGHHVLKAVATDIAGRTSEQSVSIDVIHGAPPPDTVGPEITNVRIDGAPLLDGASLSHSGQLSFNASDRSAISSIELLIDGQSKGTLAQSNAFQFAIDLDAFTDGAHVVTLRGRDSLSNVSTVSFNVNVVHGPPAAPAFDQPANATVVRTPQLTFVGHAQPGRTIKVTLNGELLSGNLVADGEGHFSGTVTLQSGPNQLSATATDSYGTSVASSSLQVTLDSSIPSGVANLSASNGAAGRVRLNWSLSGDPKVIAQDIYRATVEFTDAQQAQKIGRVPASVTTYEDAPPADARYYYRVFTVNAAETLGPASNLVSTAIDRTVPYAAKVEYATNGQFDPGSRTYGIGRLEIAVTVSEPLSATPYFSLIPAGGTPIPVELVQRDATHYAGTATLTAGSGSGEANVLFSARDAAGNRGVEVKEGGTIRIDTVGPEITSIALDTSSPIKADEHRDIVATFSYSEPLGDGKVPTLRYNLSGTGRTPAALDTPVRMSATTWRAHFQLPADAGANGLERLSFGQSAEDALGNISTRIATTNDYQVYQGQLPALEVPLALNARALPAGEIQLQWLPVDGASAYQLYRQAPGETTRTPLSRGTSPYAVDRTPTDGVYRYTVASIRVSNGQEAISGESNIAEAASSRVAPGAPQNLELTMSGQGIVAKWQAPLGAPPASYRLYRAAASVISSTQGLTPVRTGILATQTVDATPSASEHAYVVTAIDAAGNESAISNSAYLNFGLLPVRALEVEQIGSALPVLRWTPNGGGADGFDVYVGEGDARVKLTQTPLQSNTLVDSGFTAGERRYTVEAVDGSGVRMPRSILLPNVSVQVVGGLPIKRNVMNRIDVQVANLSADPMNSARVVLTIGTRTFRSETFALAANGTRVVPVVVGGFPDFPGSVSISVAVENQQHEGERVLVGKTRQAAVVDSALTVGFETDGFTRGATGAVRLSIENTSDVEVELLTANSNGSQPSDELRLKLLDQDGNLISSTPFRQATGTGVITLTTGQTVARIAPGQRYLSEPFNMPVPGSSPENVKLRLEVDKLRYSTGLPEEVAIPGIGSERAIVLANTPYYGRVDSVDPVLSFGTRDITIRGHALDRTDGQAVANAPLKIAINQEGFERLADITTDANGAFSFVFKPTATDAGAYKVGAIHPDMTDRPDQGHFSIQRVNFAPSTFKLSTPRNYGQHMEFRASTGPGTDIRGLRLVYAAQYQPSGTLMQGLQVETGAPIDIGPKQDLAIPVVVSGDNTAAPAGRLVLAVMGAETGPEPMSYLYIDYTLTEARPALAMTPAFIQSGLAQGQSTVESIAIENKGFIAVTDLTATLMSRDGSPAPSWISIASNAQLGTLSVGEKRTLDLNIAPTPEVGEGVFELVLKLSGSNLPVENVNVSVSVTQSGQGNVLFKASDIYTATRDRNGNLIQGLAGARLFVQNEAVTNQTYDVVTDAYGEAFLQNLPAGSYRYKASAANHQQAAGRFTIKPGVTVNQPVFMDYTLIQVEWSVREVTIDDRYEITLNATFETDVPAPVVLLQPSVINLPKMADGEVFQGELTLTNYGLIRADNVVAPRPGADPYYKFEFLVQPPSVLEAKQRVRLPYRVTKLRPFGYYVAGTGTSGGGGSVNDPDNPDDGDGSGGNGGSGGSGGSGGAGSGSGAAGPGGTASGIPGCYSYRYRYPVTCTYTCANGVESNACGSASYWYHVDTSSCPVGGKPSIVGIGGGNSNGGAADPGGFNLNLPGLPMCTKGAGDCFGTPATQSGNNYIQGGGR